MAVEVAQLLKETFLTSLEVEPKLPHRLYIKFQEIKESIEKEKNIWSSTTASKALLPHLYDLTDALAECRLFAEQRQELTQNFSRLNPFQQSNFVRKMIKRLNSLKERLDQELPAQYSNSSSSGMTNFPTARHTLFDSNASHVLDFGEQEKQIKALLADKGYKAIGVYGVSGSGNTALVHKQIGVLNSPWVYKEFSPIIRVRLSHMHSESENNEDIKAKIVKDMLRQLGSDVDKCSIINPSNRVLLRRLENLLLYRKYLIVFDDVWQINEFYSGFGDTVRADTIGNRLSDALPRDGGGKIIITSSLKEVAQEMVGEKNLIHMKPMNRGSCGLTLEPSTGFVQSNAAQVFGFDEQEKKIVEALLSDNGYEAIGVYGMGGSGKTLLIQKVLNNPSVYNVFFPIIWVCLSDINSDDDKDINDKIVMYILCELGNDVDRLTTLESSNTKLMDSLKNSLMCNKYLIVFDDVRKKNDFYANLGDTSPKVGTVENRLSDALPRDGGGKIVVTSRLREVAENMVGQKNLIHMEPLNKESCRLILEAGIGFLQYATEIETLLNSSGFKAIGIYGLSNSVNTAIIHKVLLSSPSVVGKFEPIIWVCDSHISSREVLSFRSEILKHMLKELKLDESKIAYRESELLEIVKRSLLSKKYLIVLADLGNKNDWYGDFHYLGYRAHWIWLFNALSQNVDGTIIVTSRIKEVAQEMVGENKLIHVRLPELGNNETSEVTIHRQYVTDEIVDKCHGLPLAAKTLANIIREKGRET